MVTQEKVRQALKKVYDPELNFNVVDLGLVYGVEVKGGKDVNVRMTMTTPFCPYAPELLSDAKSNLAQIEGIGNYDIEVVWEPPWGVDKMKSEVRAQLGLG